MAEKTMLTGIYGITDARLMPDDTSLQEKVEAALQGGLKLLQYRDKTADASKALRQARLLADLCRQYDCLLIINDDPELARASLADGVHLGQGDGCLRHARELLGTHALLGRTCHGSLALAHQARQDGADYLAFGRCFPSTTKPLAPATGLGIFAEARTLGLPCVAIGGITPELAGQVANAGAHMIAAVEGIFGAPNPALAVRQYHEACAPSFSFNINEVQHDPLSRTL
jgi:thiamine-phosphate pyrophosphorylase